MTCLIREQEVLEADHRKFEHKLIKCRQIAAHALGEGSEKANEAAGVADRI